MGENTIPAFLTEPGLGCYQTDPKAPFNPILAKINGQWSGPFLGYAGSQRTKARQLCCCIHWDPSNKENNASNYTLSLRWVCLKTDKGISLKKIQHTFALARDTFSWLLLLMRKNLASWRMYLSLLVWSEKKTKYHISWTVNTYPTSLWVQIVACFL